MDKHATNKQTKRSSADIKAQLQRAQAQFGHRHGSSDSSDSPVRETVPENGTPPAGQEPGVSAMVPAHISARAQKLNETLGGRIVTSRTGEYLLCKQFYATDYRHGHVSFSAVTSADYRLSYFSKTLNDELLTLPELLFFDTETTGLSGAGAVPFLIGVGGFVTGGFETRQYIIPDFADEAAMLADIFTEFGAGRTLVSYNGKAFDKPLLEDRLIIHRIARELPHHQHIDLLHPARALFKRRLGDCSLGNIEEQALGYFRDADIPGYLVPSVYLDWIHNDETTQLVAVIAHNRQDIVSLAALMFVIADSFITAGTTLSSPLDAYSLMQVCEKRNQREMAVRIGHEREAEFSRLNDPELEFRRSMIFKRAGELDSAVTIWERLTGADNCSHRYHGYDNSDHENYNLKLRRPAQRARLELAKWCEHRRRDYRRALELTESGLRFTLKRHSPVDDWPKRKKRLQKRITSQSRTE